MTDATGQDRAAPATTTIRYLYRDAANYKLSLEVTFDGAITVEERTRLLEALDDQAGFVPAAVGLDHPLTHSEWGYDNELDHPFCELAAVGITTGSRQPDDPDGRRISTFVQEFCETDWDAAAADHPLDDDTGPAPTGPWAGGLLPSVASPPPSPPAAGVCGRAKRDGSGPCQRPVRGGGACPSHR